MRAPRKSSRRKRSTLADIAKRTDTSVMAAAMVLNGAGSGEIRVGQEKAERIRRVAAELDYVPNHAAQQLAGKRSSTIAVLANTWFHFFQLRVLAWLNELAAPRGLKVLALQSEHQPRTFKRLTDECRAWNVDGVAFLAYDNEPSWPEAATALAGAQNVVSIMGDPGVPGGACVLSNVASGTRQAVEHLHRQGRRKIVQILENLDCTINRQRQQAFSDAHRDLGRPLQPDQLCLATQGLDRNDYDQFLVLCKDLVDARRADALIADNDFGATFIVRTLRELGRRVPDDVAVIGWGNEIIAPWFSPRLTTVDYVMRDLVGAVVDLLGNIAEDSDPPPARTITIEPRLLVRESA